MPGAITFCLFVELKVIARLRIIDIVLPTMMKRNFCLVVKLFPFLLLLTACVDNGVEVLVVDGFGVPRVGIPVDLVVMNNQGETQQNIVTQFTDVRGVAQFQTITDFGSALLFRTFAPGGEVRSFAAGERKDAFASSDTAGSLGMLDPITDAVVRAVVYVTETDGGRTIDDFSPPELRELTALARASLADATNIDFDDVDGLTNRVITEIGLNIAEAAGGSISAVALSSILAPNEVTAAPPVGTTANCPRDHVQLVGAFFIFDINEDGALCNVEATSGPIMDAFDIGMQLSLIGDTFSGLAAFPGDDTDASTPSTMTLEDERELVLGPVVSDGGISVTRKIRIPDNDDVVRFLEIFENTSSSSKTIDIRITGSVGLDSVAVLFAQNDANAIDEGSDYGSIVDVIANTTKPTLAFVFDGPGAEDGVDSATFPPQNGVDLAFSWNDVEIAAGETVIYAHYVVVSSSQVQEDLANIVEAIYDSPNMEGFFGG